MRTLLRLASELVAQCKQRGVSISCAESCTGGLLASAITSIPGSSSVFPGGVVAYANDIKVRVLGVSPGTVETFGAVSCECAREMAAGIASLMGTELAASITGIAGPDGGSPEKPLGLVWFGFIFGSLAWTEKRHFVGNRQKIREQSVEFALQELINRGRTA